MLQIKRSDDTRAAETADAVDGNIFTPVSALFDPGEHFFGLLPRWYALVFDRAVDEVEACCLISVEQVADPLFTELVIADQSCHMRDLLQLHLFDILCEIAPRSLRPGKIVIPKSPLLSTPPLAGSPVAVIKSIRRRAVFVSASRTAASALAPE